MSSFFKMIKSFFNFNIFRVIYWEILYSVIGAYGIYEDIVNKKINNFDTISNKGRTAVVTGGARGIGSSIVKKFLQCDMHVIIACRNTKAGEETVKAIRSSGITSGSYDILELDLASFASIQVFVQKLKSVCDRIHVFVNNAGIMFGPFKETEDGFESQWGINYVGPFYLTHLLMPLLVNASLNDDNVRIINVSSCAHYLCKGIRLNDINNKSKFVSSVSYAQSKAAQILFTNHLAKLLNEEKINISVFSVHPGIVNTDLFNGTFMKIFAPWILTNFCKNADEGATTIVYASLSPKLRGTTGQYLSNCVIRRSSKFCQDLKMQEKLFSFTLEKLKIEYFYKP